jgi:two-component system OmpR family response regulator
MTPALRHGGAWGADAFAMNKPEHVLVVDDDPEIRELLARYLARNGYRVSVAEDAGSLERALNADQVDLVILDIMMPGPDGLEITRDLRARSEIPIIMLTARGDDTDRIVGLEMGADDYLPKPFNPRELLARIKTVLRRAAAPLARADAPRPKRLRFAGWTLDLAARELCSADGIEVALTAGEFDLLAAFAEHPLRVLSRDLLLDLTRGRHAGPFDRSIDVQVGRLRRRIEADPKDPKLVKTVRGGGYMFAAPVERA